MSVRQVLAGSFGANSPTNNPCTYLPATAFLTCLGSCTFAEPACYLLPLIPSKHT
jgi:hypothetical protein